MPDHNDIIQTKSGSMVVGVGTVKPMCMCKNPDIGRIPGKVSHMSRGAGRLPNVVNIGVRATGRKTAGKIITGRIITERIITERIITGTGK